MLIITLPEFKRTSRPRVLKPAKQRNYGGATRSVGISRGPGVCHETPRKEEPRIGCGRGEICSFTLEMCEIDGGTADASEGKFLCPYTLEVIEVR